MNGGAFRVGPQECISTTRNAGVLVLRSSVLRSDTRSVKSAGRLFACSSMGSTELAAEVFDHIVLVGICPNDVKAWLYSAEEVHALASEGRGPDNLQFAIRPYSAESLARYGSGDMEDAFDRLRAVVDGSPYLALEGWFNFTEDVEDADDESEEEV